VKNHVLRPLWVAIALIVTVLLVRKVMVPADFGVHGRNFTYGFHRLGAIDDWKAFPVKYRGREACAECHEDKSAENAGGKHHVIQCENCHGPLLQHPDDPEKLPIERTRALCLRCHTSLPYPTSKRGKLPAIDPNEHNPDEVCSECHNPHNPDLSNM